MRGQPAGGFGFAQAAGRGAQRLQYLCSVQAVPKRQLRGW